MIYTIENVYIQPVNNHHILFNTISPQQSIIYLPTPITSYTYTQPIQTQYIYSVKPINQQTTELKKSSHDFLQKERIKSPIKRPITPLTAEEQLDLNLLRYGYRRQFVNGDGNCFFTAIASQLITLYNQDRSFRIAIKQRLNLPENIFNNTTQLARTLRKLVCLEWKINDSKYKPYINDVNYYDEIRKFRSDKFYSSILGDILPLTISNLMGINIKIITNLTQCPLIDICPQDEPKLSMKSIPILTLAYNQENDGHYDIAIDKRVKDY
ncbi:unnamed protein product [Adineta steineri]|uniref:OTU domain-containing protein n=1 Tax=Adineta steineri TaxID=433720 RepID=A0A814KT48_9BILA|nr:unnamed protein product [Adineta steineri]CAF1056613.1 unnamed protein product [Adineta steineri]